MKVNKYRNTLQLLLSKGYFPKELPPVFTTADFGEHADEILDTWEKSHVFDVKTSKDFAKIKGKRMRGRRGYKIVDTEPEIVSKPKRLYERRNIHITHPVPQALLSKEISQHWREVQKFLSKVAYSDDEIVVGEEYERSIKGINFPLHRAKTRYIEATADWLVKTDISRFYPGIYTHSIAWAAYGKKNVKAFLKRYEGSFADRLDTLVRACNRNQTIGIPVGPETSRIIAEIISAQIDAQFSSMFPKMRAERVDRLQDDWVLGARTLQEAENILSAISACYREYGLEINGHKTSITHIVKGEADSWMSELSSFSTHRKEGLFGSRLSDFFNVALKLQIDHPSKAVMNYALTITEGMTHRREDIQAIESFLLQAAAISPASLDRICRVILNLNHRFPGRLSSDRLVRRFGELLERHLENGSVYEAIWILYTLRGLKKTFRSRRIVELAKDVPSSALRLLLLDMHSKGLCSVSPPVSQWESEVSEERVLADWTWLYAYEGIRHGWIADTNNVMSAPFFEALNSKDVRFYDESRNIKTSQAFQKMRKRVRAQQNKEVVAMLMQLRGVTESPNEPWSEY